MFLSLRYLKPGWHTVSWKKANFLQQQLAVEPCLGGSLGYMVSGLTHLRSVFGLGFLCSMPLAEEMADVVLFPEFRGCH